MAKNFSSIEKFLYSFAIIQFLRNRAWFSACFIEYIILSCTQIDAMLRWAIVLKGQIINKNKKINEKWLKKNLKERLVFNKGLDLKILDKKLVKEFHRLYDARNIIIHRFMITDVDYEFSKRIASQFEPMIARLMNILFELEEEQIKKQIGITQKGQLSKNEEKKLVKNIEKYFSSKIGDKLEKINRVRSHKWPDVEDIVDFASRKGLLKKIKKERGVKATRAQLTKNPKEKSKK